MVIGVDVVVMPSKAIENDEKTSIMNLSEISHQHAITSAIRHQINLKHFAAANSRYFNYLKRDRLGKDVILTSFSKSPEILCKRLN